ncbi:MAG: class II glutamine amidotransferase [Thermoproteus sp. CIS_19]|jgi:Predicted glutamine amidotransferase|nr:MAG: class II glutamine amidotransferase [Thermoproteus sp. CIS_19]
MCRILLFFGDPRPSLFRSFVEISRRDRTLGLSHGSGWGVLYAREGEYGLYKSVKPIWESYIDPPSGYKLYLLHSRLASVGGISPGNTHPIVYGDFAIAHNGTFRREELARELKGMGLDVRTGGATDSELFLKAFVDMGGDAEALEEVAKIAARHMDPEEPMMNIAIADLRTADAYFLTYRLVEEPHYVPVARADGVTAVASEPLDDGPWSPLPNGALAKISSGSIRVTKFIT